jgi:glutamine synthetase
MGGGERSEQTPEGVQQRLVDAGVQVVACTFVDLAGVSRVKGVPVARLAEAARYGVGMSYVSTVFTVDDQIASSPDYGSPVGDMRLRPDLGSLVVFPDAPAWAWAPVDQDTQELEPVAACPRHALKRWSSRAAQAGLELRMAVEVEFTLLDEQGEPAHRGPGYGTRALFDTGDLAPELVEVLTQQGIEVQQIHPEYAPSQYEISIAPADPLHAADQVALLRTTIIRVAARHGYQVSFAPLPTLAEVGNGAHLHLSLWAHGRSLMVEGSGTAGLTTTAESFLAGLLQRLPECMAVFAPSVPSYARLQPSHWSAPFVCWGPENREAAVRLVSGTVGTRGYSANAEVKPIDGSANTYLVMALVIAAGLDGLRRAASLPEPVTVDPATLGEVERDARGISRLPADLSVAARLLDESSWAREALGDPLVDAVLAVRALEGDAFAQAEPDELRRGHRWRYG